MVEPLFELPATDKQIATRCEISNKGENYHKQNILVTIFKYANVTRTVLSTVIV